MDSVGVGDCVADYGAYPDVCLRHNSDELMILYGIAMIDFGGRCEVGWHVVRCSPSQYSGGCFVGGIGSNALRVGNL